MEESPPYTPIQVPPTEKEFTDVVRELAKAKCTISELTSKLEAAQRQRDDQQLQLTRKDELLQVQEVRIAKAFAVNEKLKKLLDLKTSEESVQAELRTLIDASQALFSSALTSGVDSVSSNSVRSSSSEPPASPQTASPAQAAADDNEEIQIVDEIEDPDKKTRVSRRRRAVRPVLRRARKYYCSNCGRLFGLHLDWIEHQWNCVNMRRMDTRNMVPARTGVLRDRIVLVSKRANGIRRMGLAHRNRSRRHVDNTISVSVACTDCGLSFNSAEEHFRHRQTTHGNYTGQPMASTSAVPLAGSSRAFTMMTDGGTTSTPVAAKGNEVPQEEVDEVVVLDDEDEDESMPTLTKEVDPEVQNSRSGQSAVIHEIVGPKRKPNGYTGTYDCTCGKIFKRRESLYRHTRIENHGKNFQCDLCFKTFAIHIQLKKHIERVHDAIYGDGTFGCTFCGDTFTSRELLHVHQASKECNGRR